MSSQARRRFYREASVNEANGIVLDGRPVRTPLKAPLELPSRALAAAVAEEWQAQGERIKPEDMILTKLANTAIDRVAPERARIAAEIARFAGFDLVCYRAESPDELVRLQAQAWDPVLEWALATLDAGFTITKGIIHREQPASALAAFRAHISEKAACALTALHNMATLTGSALIAAMTAAGDISSDAAWHAAHVDEDWQIEQWGEDAEAAARRARMRREFDACCRFLDLSR